MRCLKMLERLMASNGQRGRQRLGHSRFFFADVHRGVILSPLFVADSAGPTAWSVLAVNIVKCGLMALLIWWPGSLFAQAADWQSADARNVDTEPVAVLELGAAPTVSLKGEGWSFGPTAAVEFTPIEERLELEAGITALFSRSSTEWDVDLLFKKPWTLSKKAELMVGIGPEWIHIRQSGVTTNSVAGEGALDFMYWPSARHRFGWYVEPSYEYNFARGHEQSIGITGGLLIAIPRHR